MAIVIIWMSISALHARNADHIIDGEAEDQKTNIKQAETQRGKGIFEAIMKTCINCANPCSDYFNSIAPKCNTLLGQDANQLRQYMAEMCNDYKPAPQRFFTYSNGETYYG